MVGKAGDMKVKLSPEFYKKIKGANVRIRKNFKERITIFQKNPDDPRLNNHSLHSKYTGYSSINITADWRAIFEIIGEGENAIAWFIDLGTHKGLYK